MSGPNLDHVAAWVRRQVRHPSPRGVRQVAAQAVASAYVPFFVSPLAPPVLGALGGRGLWRGLLGVMERRPPAEDGHAPSLRRDMVSGLRYYRANAVPLHHPRERTTRVPVLQLVLARDVAVRPASLAESERWTESLERRELPLGHWAPLTHPDVVADETARFVRSLEP